MLDHIILTVSDIKRSLAFYEAALKPLNIKFFMPYRGKDGHPDLWGFGDGKKASDRFLQRESIAYARATFAGSRVFQASSASRTFCIALSRVNGGKGSRAGVVGVAIIFSWN
jgi:catechol 2,3-dioxygenase-like lactoylglutathione lyase family enzyme